MSQLGLGLTRVHQKLSNCKQVSPFLRISIPLLTTGFLWRRVQMTKVQSKLKLQIFFFVASVFLGIAFALPTQSATVSADYYCPVQESGNCICWGCMSSGSPRKCFCGNQGGKCSAPNCSKVDSEGGGGGIEPIQP